MSLDPETGEIRTTTTRVDDVTGEVYQTTVSRRAAGPGPLTWGLGVLGVVAIVALVYMFVSSNNRTADAQARLDAQNTALAISAAAPITPYPDPAVQAQVAAAQTQAVMAQAQTQAAAQATANAAAQASDDRSAAAAERAAAAADRAAAERARQQTPPMSANDQTPQQ